MSTSAEGIVEWATLFRGKAHSNLITLKVVVDLADIDPVIEDDEAILESIDGEYKKTLKVAEVAERIDKDHLQLTFKKVIPSKRYTLTYDLKKDSHGNELGKFDIFYSVLIEPKENE